MTLLVDILIVWVILLSLILMFEKSRVDCLEKQIWCLERYITEPEEPRK